MHACVLRLLKLCLTLCDSVDHSLPGSSVYGISQARLLEWVAVPSFRVLSKPGIEPSSLMSPALANRFSTSSTTWEIHVKNIKTLPSTFTYVLALSFKSCQLFHHAKEASFLCILGKHAKSPWQVAYRRIRLRCKVHLYSQKNEGCSQISELCVGGLRFGGRGGSGSGQMCSKIVPGLSQELTQQALCSLVTPSVDSSLPCWDGEGSSVLRCFLTLGQGIWMEWFGFWE